VWCLIDSVEDTITDEEYDIAMAIPEENRHTRPDLFEKHTATDYARRDDLTDAQLETLFELACEAEFVERTYQVEINEKTLHE